MTVPGQPVAFEDSIATDSDWETEGNWALVDEPGRGQVYTDSPDGYYGNLERTALVSPSFSLEDFENSKLYLDLKTAIGYGDEVTVEVHGKGWFFRRWRKVATFEGGSDWKTHALDLSKYDGQDRLKLRIRLKSNHLGNYDGVSVDRVVVSGDPID